MIAEDDPLMAGMLEETLVANGYDVCGTAGTVEKAVELGERYKPDLAVLDIRLADGGLGTEIPARFNISPTQTVFVILDESPKEFFRRQMGTDSVLGERSKNRVELDQRAE